MTYYTVYKITNKINGKIYIGVHKTKNLNDNYMGSGKHLKYSIDKYGIDNFKKEILFIFDNPEEMFAKEAELVNEDFVNNKSNYNLKTGGYGGWTTEISIKGNTSDKRNHDQIQRKIRKSLAKKGNSYSKIGSRTLKILHSQGRVRYNTFTGKKHSDKTKKIISNKAKDRLKNPVNNSQYGTMWIYSLEEKISKKISKNETIPKGWYKGRKLNFN